MKKFRSWVAMGVLLVVASTSARAQVFLKPAGLKAMPLRVQSLSAEVEIIGGVAVTNWTMTIPLENVGFIGGGGQGAVCDFICVRPRDAKVTAFSVQHWDDITKGRVEERAALAPRVAFAAAKDDPLVRSGLSAGNSFRATVFPVRGWSDITVHGTWVQSLASSRTGATYRLPLLALRGATMRLPQLSAKVTVRGGTLPTISNNYRLPAKPQNGARVLSLSQKNYRVLRDLTVTLQHARKLASTGMLAAPDAATGGGNFALAFVAPRALRNLAISGAGIQASSFSSASASAGDIITASGTYRGDANALKAQFSADGLGKIALVPVPNEAARSLWATQQINGLSVNVAANHDHIISLSKKYGVVSPFTSWVVASDDDLKIYRYAVASSQLDPLVREYWLRVGDGQERGARVAQLKKVIGQISTANGLNGEDELNTRLGSAYAFVVWQKYARPSEIKVKVDKAQVAKRVTRLSDTMLRYVTTLTGKKVKRENDSAPLIYAGELLDLRTNFVREYRKLHPDYAKLAAWELRFSRLYGSTTSENPSLAFWRAEIVARELELRATLAEKAGDNPKVVQFAKARSLNSQSVYFTNNIGDPPIYVSAPADARQVVAVMPDGNVKTLDYNRWEKRWEGNYDVPVGTRDGGYKIQILVVNADGSRQNFVKPFRVDTHPPTGKGTVQWTPDVSPNGERTLRLEVEHGGDTAVVLAFLPWGEKVSLLPSTVRKHTFFALVPVPRDYKADSVKVLYTLIDRAHNTTSLESQLTPHSTAP